MGESVTSWVSGWVCGWVRAWVGFRGMEGGYT